MKKMSKDHLLFIDNLRILLVLMNLVNPLKRVYLKESKQKYGVSFLLSYRRGISSIFSCNYSAYQKQLIDIDFYVICTSDY